MKRTPHRARNVILGVTGGGLVVASLALRTPDPAAVASLPDDVASDAAPNAPDRLHFTGAGLGPEWDLPNLEHPRIDYWVDRFVNVADMREKFEGFIERGGELAPMILERLEARGMPRDLLYLAMIESGFNAHAVSSARAVGVWQFMAPTGQRFGLAIDRAVDERRDPIRATEAALDYLEVLHRQFGSWYLAAAAYNSGEGRVARAMRQQFGRTRAASEHDYYRIWERLPAETRDYVPLMIAAARITKDPAAHGFEPIRPAPRSWDTLTFPPATPLAAIARETGVTIEQIRDYNPHLLIERTPNDRNYELRMPAGTLTRLAAAGVAVKVTRAE
jgi:membrane-bound lytic murein transglycosylase D